MSIAGFARELLRAQAADILPIRMRGTGHRWLLQDAVAATAWLLLLCAAGACTGPGLEPPEADVGGERPEDGGGGGGAAAGGTGGGAPSVPGDAASGDGDGDGDDLSDAGEAPRDGGVDEDGGTDPEDLEP